VLLSAACCCLRAVRESHRSNSVCMLFGTLSGLNTLRLALPGALLLRAWQSVIHTDTLSVRTDASVFISHCQVCYVSGLEPCRVSMTYLKLCKSLQV
jgi:hypothetical protein